MLSGVLTALLLAACHKPDPAPSTYELLEAGVEVCADPSIRETPPYHDDRQTPDTQPIEGANLSGGGVAVEDYDEDGYMDVFLPGERTIEFRWGRADGLFDESASVSMSGIDLGMSVGATNVDIDADGDVDLLVIRWERTPVLLRNNGDRTFTDITAGTGLDTYSTKAQSASWADIDADGDLDLFIGSYGEKAIIDVNEPTANCSDHIPDMAQLWRNDGDGHFTDLNDLLPDAVHDGYIFMSGFYDLDGDSYPELFTAHDDGRCAGSVLLDNDGGDHFTLDEGTNFDSERHDMGMAVGDLNGDELPDMALTSWTSLAVLQSLPSEGAANGVLWVDAAASREIVLDTEVQVYGWGTEWGDLDNDTDLDLVAVFGYWDYYQGAGDPAVQFDGLWIQDEAGQFSQRAAEWKVGDGGWSRSVVLADVNGDGWLDIVKRVLNTGTPMYLSHCGDESWLIVRLWDEGSNRDAIGAKIRAIDGDNKQVRWMQSGSSGMYSGSPLEVHFGLGAAETVDLEIVWPDGEVGRIEDVPARQRVTVKRIRPQ